MNTFKPKFYSDEELDSIKEEDLVFPYSDNHATYDPKKHQYVLTEKFFTERGHNLENELRDKSNPNKVNEFLEYLSLKVYNYIYSHCRSTRNQINYLIAKRGLYTWDMYEYREQFLEAMFIEGEYLIENGDISFITGIDIDTMQNMSGDVMRNQDRDFHKDTIALLKQLGLSYYGTYQFRVCGKGEEW